jgi:hypothetical protein
MAIYKALVKINGSLKKKNIFLMYHYIEDLNFHYSKIYYENNTVLIEANNTDGSVVAKELEDFLGDNFTEIIWLDEVRFDIQTQELLVRLRNNN